MWIHILGVSVIFTLAYAKNHHGLGAYDSKNIVHHNTIKAGVEKKPLKCKKSEFEDGETVDFSLVCSRKSNPIIGTCHWRKTPNGGVAKFEKRRPSRIMNHTIHPSNEMRKCGCELGDYRSLDSLDPCESGLRIDGPQEEIMILATSAVKITIDIKKSVQFWIEYAISSTRNHSDTPESVRDGHSLIITHWYNTIFSKGTWHVVHTFRDPQFPTSQIQIGKNQTKITSIYRAYMIIDSTTVDESGLYTFEISNGQLSATLAFVLNVRSEQTQLNFYARKSQPGHSDPFEAVNPRFVQAMQKYEIICAATLGDQESVRNLTLNLYRTPCIKNWSGQTVCRSDQQKLPLIDLNENTIEKLDPMNGITYSFEKHGRYLIIIYTVNASEPGVYDCAISSDQSIIDTGGALRFVPSHIENALEKNALEIDIPSAWDQKTNSYNVYESDQIILECKYQNIDYRFQRWQSIGPGDRAHTIIHNTTRHTLMHDRSSNVPYATGISRLIIREANPDLDTGRYVCELIDTFENKSSAVNVEIRVNVLKAVAPRFERHENQSIIRIEINETESITLDCSVKIDTSPAPVITWFKNGDPITNFHTFNNENQEMQFRRILDEDSGNYICQVGNRFGVISKEFLINVISWRNRPATVIHTSDQSKKSLIITVCVLVIFLITLASVLGVISVKKYRKKKKLNALHEQLIASTKENLDPIDPRVPIHQQLKNLPYDPQYEIGKDQLVLGIILGEGQFGKVLDGYIFSKNGENPIHVAVKVPKDGMDITQQKMLLSEFKIMAYVGNHVNVISLISSITHRMPKGELYVASEYCEHGSLRDYLIKNRWQFQDELIMPFEKNGYIFGNEFRRSRASAGGQMDIASIDHSLGRALKTSDLLSFSYQVANGMDYLASKNVVHRDLALRNILLTKDMVVKIGDFGLALHRLDEEKSNSLKSDIPLPVKWMALESILYGEYSVQSDIWSFGVVVWEIFSLSAIPYPDKAPSPVLADWLLAGNRLSPPKYAPEEIYHLMTKCWLERPTERPTFTECRDGIGIEMHLRWQCEFEYLQNALNGYHAYVNVKGSTVSSDDESPMSKLLNPSMDIDPEQIISMAIENPEYNLRQKPSAVAVENPFYDDHAQKKKVNWV